MTNFIRKTAAFLRIMLARLRFLAVFAIVGLVVGYWDNIKNHVDKWTRPALAPDVLAAHADVEYYCVMHPNIIRAEPGNCPICGMPLARRKRGEILTLPQGVLARVQLTPHRMALAGIATSPIEPRQLVRQIKTIGVLDYNETKVAQLSARIAGRADELFVKFTGQQVNAGDPVYSLYSPELYTAQREYLLARKRVNDLPADASAEARADASAVYNSSMQKLVLWGVTSEALDKLDHEFDRTGQVPTHYRVTSPISGIVVRKNIYEGAYVNVGDTPYTIADLHSLWLQAAIYEQDVPLVKVGDAAEVVVSALPNKTFKGAVTFLSYQLDPQTRTLAARIEVTNPQLTLRPGMFAEAFIKLPVKPAPATQPGARPANGAVIALERARAFQAALKPYLQASDTLAHDKSENVSALLHQTRQQLEPLAKAPDLAENIKRLTTAVHGAMGQGIDDLRESFRHVSVEMIAIGKAVGIPSDAPAVKVFRCPMGPRPNWLQEAADTINPYMGTRMLNCGGPIDALPRVAPAPAPAATDPLPPGKVLSIPRTAVINTGRHMVVFVENPEIQGAFDMRQVKLGPIAGDYYPVESGLTEADRVVTHGAFLLDAENRLNPTLTRAAATDPAPSPAHEH